MSQPTQADQQNLPHCLEGAHGAQLGAALQYVLYWLVQYLGHAHSNVGWNPSLMRGGEGELSHAGHLQRLVHLHNHL